MRILLVEDEPRAAQMLAKGLREQAYAVDIASNGIEAIEAIRKETYAAVLMDCQMPELDGFETTRRIRDIEGLRTMPIIAITANALSGDQEKCLAAGMDDYLTKPIRYEALMKALEKWTRDTASARRAA